MNAVNPNLAASGDSAKICAAPEQHVMQARWGLV